MRKLFRSRSFYISLTVLLIGTAALFLFLANNRSDEERVMATVDEGPVRQIVSVSGAINAEDTAELGFPVGGIVRTVHVRKGDIVATGTPLITLDAAALQAEVMDASAALAAAQADYAELLAGATNETLAVQTETVRQKEDALARTKKDEALKVENALRTLRSTNLTAYTNKANVSAPAPTITGTYNCSDEGSYTLSVYSSNADSGYSFALTGLERGTFVAATDQPISFGTCGLRVQFTDGARYHGTVWHIDIPNTLATSYTTNKNAYDLALANQKSAIEAAERALALARAEAATVAAPARSEARARAEANVAQAQAQVARAVANRNDAVLIAPFSGTVVSVVAVAGEAVGSSPVITLLSPDRYELTARIPEIDIGKLLIGQSAEVVFDTADSETLTATIDFLSPNATTIDGVAYYEARLALATRPAWIRSGLNADIDIIVNETTALRVPRRFVTEQAGEYSVLVARNAESIATTTVEVTLMGNDGFVAIRGLAHGDVIVAP